MIVTNFWNTVEMECVYKDLSYDEYIQCHKDQNSAHDPLHIRAYFLLKVVFDMNLMEESVALQSKL